ncbi:MAG: hypothetical protein U5J99_09415 [Parvularculaceae bacterium]|nr:hypothetical protein [Parvularculaceae bacterium]
MSGAKNSAPPKAPEVFDESPAGLMAVDLTFNYFKTIMNGAFTLIGGAIILKGALVPEAPIERNFIVGILLISLAAVCGLEGQHRTIVNLRKKHVGKLYRQALLTIGPGALGIGTGALFSYFLKSFGQGTST